MARGRIAIAQHWPENLTHTLFLIRLLRTAIVGRQVKAQVARIRRSGGRPDPGAVLNSWVGKLVTDGGYGFVGAGAEVNVGISVVGEALDTIRSGGLRFYDRDVASVAGWIG